MPTVIRTGTLWIDLLNNKLSTSFHVTTPRLLRNITLFESNVLLVETLSNPDHFDSSLSGKSPLKGPLMVPYSAVTILI